MTSPSDRLNLAIFMAGHLPPLSPDIQAEVDAAARWPVAEEVRAWTAEQDRIARGLGHANYRDRCDQRFYEREQRRTEIEDFRRRAEDQAKNAF